MHAARHAMHTRASHFSCPISSNVSPRPTHPSSFSNRVRYTIFYTPPRHLFLRPTQPIHLWLHIFHEPFFCFVYFNNAPTSSRPVVAHPSYKYPARALIFCTLGPPYRSLLGWLLYGKKKKKRLRSPRTHQAVFRSLDVGMALSNVAVAWALACQDTVHWERCSLIGIDPSAGRIVPVDCAGRGSCGGGVYSKGGVLQPGGRGAGTGDSHPRVRRWLWLR